MPEMISSPRGNLGKRGRPLEIFFSLLILYVGLNRMKRARHETQNLYSAICIHATAWCGQRRMPSSLKNFIICEFLSYFVLAVPHAVNGIHVILTFWLIRWHSLLPVYKTVAIQLPPLRPHPTSCAHSFLLLSGINLLAMPALLSYEGRQMDETSDAIDEGEPFIHSIHVSLAHIFPQLMS